MKKNNIVNKCFVCNQNCGGQISLKKPEQKNTNYYCSWNCFNQELTKIWKKESGKHD